MRYGHLTFGELSIMDKEFYISMGYHDQVPDQCILNYINEIKKIFKHSVKSDIYTISMK